jgi:hypothetical protein
VHDKTITSRREALAFASLAATFVIAGDAVAQPAKAGKLARPTKEEFARARRLFGGELGGFKETR